VVTLSVQKWLQRFTNGELMHTDRQRFTNMLILAAALHLILLLSFDVRFSVVAPLKKMMATMLDVTLTVPEEAVSSVVANNNTENEKIEQLKNKQEAIPDGPTLYSQSLQTTKPTAAGLRKRTISAASHENKDADYLARWQSYVEQYGNSHYPEIALRNKLRGDLRLLVAVNKDGTLHEVIIRQSSGSPKLDQEAIKLVHQAAPFEPLPPEIAQDVEILEIIRTWQFRGTLSTS
jgi:TonB family protein